MKKSSSEKHCRLSGNIEDLNRVNVSDTRLHKQTRSRYTYRDRCRESS
jgi:hypothetical protein